ncbi:MAG: phosphoribosylanthranilate isomerase [bacterium]|nr:phosphoribosylanthranilate isomerase [bacterium]MBU1918050.1 phosphoribosylanthranilate isomerase [bacterium]
MALFIQIAGIKSFDEAQMILDLGADLIGFPLKLGYHKEDVNEDEAAAIIQKLGKPEKCCLITYLNLANDIHALCSKLGVLTVQLHGDVTIEELIKLKQLNPSYKIIKSLIVKYNNLDELKNNVTTLSPHIDMFITDTFDPKTGASGATGKTHDWNVSKELVTFSSKPIILAGGLNPTNVQQAIQLVQPYGVDVHSGVENEWGNKDSLLVETFVTKVII